MGGRKVRATSISRGTSIVRTGVAVLVSRRGWGTIGVRTIGAAEAAAEAGTQTTTERIFHAIQWTR